MLRSAELAARRRRPLRSRAGRRVPGHQRAAGRDPAGAEAGRRAASPWSATTRRRSTPSAPPTVRNILDFPGRFAPPAAVVTLEQNYRSTQPILDAANAVIGLATRALTQGAASRTARSGAAAALWRSSTTSWRQVDYVVERRSSRTARPGCRCATRRCCCAPRTTAPLLEVELGRRNIPYREVRRPQVPRGGARQGRARRSCAGPRTRATRSPRSACCSSCPASVPAPPAGSGCDRVATARLRRAGQLRAAGRGRASTGPGSCELLSRSWPAAPWPVSSAWCARFYEPLLVERYDDAGRAPRRSRAARAHRRAPIPRASGS